MDSCRHLMLAEMSPAAVDVATDLAIPIVARGGFGALTPSAIATAAGCTRQAVHQWFGGQVPLRSAVSHRFVARWCRWVDVRVHLAGPVALLPETDEVVEWCRVWLALIGAAAFDAEAAGLVRVVRAEERSRLESAVRRPSAPMAGPAQVHLDQQVDGLHCLIEGLRARLTHRGDGLTLEAARAIVEGVVGPAPAPGRHVA